MQFELTTLSQLAFACDSLNDMRCMDNVSGWILFCELLGAFSYKDHNNLQHAKQIERFLDRIIHVLIRHVLQCARC